jgi:hypothetical protein
MVFTDLEKLFQDNYIRDMVLLTMYYDLMAYLAQSYARSVRIGLTLLHARTTVVAQLVNLLALADLAPYHDIIKTMTAIAKQVKPAPPLPTPPPRQQPLRLCAVMGAPPDGYIPPGSSDTQYEEEEDDEEDDNDEANAAEDNESTDHSIPEYEEDTYSTHSTPLRRTSTSSIREPEYVPRRLSHPSYRPAQAPSPMRASQMLSCIKCLTEAGYKNTPWDLKLFFKWTAAKKPVIIIAHSEDFRWFVPEENLDEWDNVIKIFNSHGYQVTDATDKEFVGIKISRDEQLNYYMDQHRMIETILEEAGINGTKDEHLPYPNSTQQPKPLSKLDCAQTDEEKIKSSRYPYRRVVGQLMYGMVHTKVCIMYALNVLSRYGNKPGDRHIAFLKHLLRYVKYSQKDRIKFKSHPGPCRLQSW